MEGRLITNNTDHNFYTELKDSLLSCKGFDMSIAFINYSGLQLMLDVLKEVEEKGIKGRILTSNYLSFTEPKALERLREFNNIDTKIFLADKRGFHTKGYFFKYRDYNKIFIGSSNLTQSALKHNVEWNLSIQTTRKEFNNHMEEEFHRVWEEGSEITDEFLEIYKKAKTLSDRAKQEVKRLEVDYKREIKPNYMQEKAVESLKELREAGENKALVIASTGSGKTYMSAFDVKEFRGRSVLFIVHREEILRDTIRTFESVGAIKKGEASLFGGGKKEKGKHVFAMIQTLGRYYKEFREDEFDYIIVDEAHHATSPSYQNILNYFKPKFLLGMTATPERCDGGDIFEIFNDNIALDLRLRDAFEHDLLAPFHYFGIADTTIDYKDLKLDEVSKISKLLQINKRVDFILDKMKFYGHDGEKLIGLGFCVDVAHARYMSEEFQKRGVHSIYLTGDNSSEERREAIRRLQDNGDTLEMIFTVDIFNEGIDIPKVNLVLMLRPTSSPIVFVQQLGRGLRKSEAKEYLTVLDFIGNHNRAFLIALALNGKKFYDKDSLKVSVAKDFTEIPGCTHIQMDRISKERILAQLENENFNALKYLKEEYYNFKGENRGKIPRLLDYLRYEGAPNPLKFIRYSKNYLNFLKKVDTSFDEYLEEDFLTYYTQLTELLPIRRPYEFAVIECLFDREKVTLKELEDYLKKYIKTPTRDNLVNAVRFLNGDFFDDAKLSKRLSIISLEDQDVKIEAQFLEGFKRYREYFIDLIHYGLLCYEDDFGRENYGIPFLKRYEQYNMADVALVSNYEKKHSAFRGSGLLTVGNDYFLFIELHKDEEIKESINYKDKFVTNEVFQWQSPNATTQESERGKNIIFNKERGINLHLFVRKYKAVDGVTQKYIYLGKGDVLKYEGNKPITVEIELESKVPPKIYREFILKV